MASLPQPPRLAMMGALEPASPRLPSNIEAEQALLGAVLIDNRLLDELPVALAENHFHEPLHGRVWHQIRRLADLNMVASPVTLRPLFESDPAMAELGGPAYLLRLVEEPTVLLVARDAATQVRDLAMLRELVRVGTALVANATDTSDEVAPMRQVELAEEQLYRIAETGEAGGGAVRFAQAATRALEQAEKAMKSGGHLSGLTTGLAGLNARLGGLHDSDLVILAGRPGMGKTALATNIAFACARRALVDARDSVQPSSGAPVAFFSLEMSADQLATRVLAEQSGITGESLRTGRIRQEDYVRLARASAELAELPLYIDDTPALSIAGLRSRARRLKRQRGIGLVVVDYLQLLQGSLRANAENRVNEISEITRGLKTLAKELQVPVLALSQLSRAVENREDKKPQLSDLRESGTIEQDADMVLFVFREEYYHAMRKPEDGSEKFAQWQEKGDRIRGRAEVLVAKQRHGATGTVELVFDARITRFADPADDWQA